MTDKNRKSRAGSIGRTSPATNTPTTGVPNQDWSTEFEMPIGILEQLIAIAIDEIGNGGGRAIALLLPALRYVNDIKALNHQLLQAECSAASSNAIRSGTVGRR